MDPGKARDIVEEMIGERHVGDFQELSQEDAAFLLQALAIERTGQDLPPEDVEASLLASIVKKRIDVLQLPVKYTTLGLLSIGCFAKNPGKAIVVLIDFLEKFENETITAEKLCTLYPWGFYNERSFTDYVDNFIRAGKARWAKIY